MDLVDGGDDPGKHPGSARYVVRRGVDEEAEAQQLAAVHIEAWQWAYRGLMPDEYLRQLDSQRERRITLWRNWLAADPAQSAVWVAAEGPAIVGFASTGPPSQASDAVVAEAQLYAIYLVERLVGKGIGHALMSAALNEMRRQGYVASTLWVLESNQLARRFYEREGWAPDGGRQVDSSPGFDLIEVRYRRSL